MAWKIYKSGAFIVCNDTVTGAVKELNSEFVQIQKTSSVDVYDVLYNGASQLKVNLANIQDENGDAYTENAFDTFRLGSVGSKNSTSASADVTYDNTTSGLSATNVQTAIDEVVASVPISYTETIVNISSAQILDMGSNPIELLPAAGVGKYYDIDKVVLEYTFNTIAYTTTEPVLYLDGAFFGNINTAIILIGENNVGIFKHIVTDTFETGSSVLTYPLFTNQNLTLNTWNGTNPTDGDGTLRVKIYHKTITFGA